MISDLFIAQTYSLVIKYNLFLNRNYFLLWIFHFSPLFDKFFQLDYSLSTNLIHLFVKWGNFFFFLLTLWNLSRLTRYFCVPSSPICGCSFSFFHKLFKLSPYFDIIRKVSKDKHSFHVLKKLYGMIIQLPSFYNFYKLEIQNFLYVGNIDRILY